MPYFTRRLLLATLSAVAVHLPQAVLANVPVPVRELAPRIQQRANIPILIPATLPSSERLYTTATQEPGGYSLSFDYTPDCGGSTPCNWGQFDASRDDYPPLSRGTARDEFRAVTLANGIRGQYLNGCGAYCTASLQWRSRGVTYTVYVKNGTLAQVMAVANSAIQGGVRNTPYTTGTAATLTSQEAGSRINVRDAASTQANVRHYGLGGDRVTILGSSVDRGGDLWYRVRFNRSGAEGWIRGDFVTR